MTIRKMAGWSLIPWPEWARINLQTGKKLRRYYDDGNINNATMHIRGIVDESYIVSRIWSKRHRDWRYQIDHVWLFELMYEKGHLKSA